MNDTLTNVLCSIVLGLTYKYLYAIMAVVLWYIRRLL